MVTLGEPGFLRVTLVTGLVIHKLLWEVLKRRRPPAPRSRERHGLGVVAVKGGKLAVLAFLVVQTLFLDVWPIAAEPRTLRAVGLGVFAAGLALAIAGRWQLGRNWADLEDYTVLADQVLVAHGIYRYLRHPIYVGDIILLVGLEIALNSWLVLAVIPIVLVVVRQARAEEELLKQALPGYAEYCLRTKRFIPLIV
jgi:protein-S-isoprenylcysteine O-methyltransferase Ste14